MDDRDSVVEHSALQGLRLLVVDDDAELMDFLVEMSTDAGLEAEGVTSGEAALAAIADRDFHVVLADVEMPDLRGPELMERIHAIRPQQLVILMTAFGSIELAVRAVRSGAADFLTKPFQFEALLMSIERARRERSMRREIVRLQRLLGVPGDGEIVAESPLMKRALRLASKVAASDATVTLAGESGVGKTSLAAWIHKASARRAAPFISVNCAALPANLVESELFGARRGAYTGAHTEREGLFRAANGGTLFLDEVGELPLEVQPKLLAVLESGLVRKVGADRDERVDVRVIAASNRDLEELVKGRLFRADLFFRLQVIRIAIPPLRERPEDLWPLIDALISRATRRIGRDVAGISAEALRMLARHDWPGNVRELSNVIERAVVMTEHDHLVPEDFDLPDLIGPSGPGGPPPADPGALLALGTAARARASLAQIEDIYIREVLASVGGNKAEAARILGIDRRTLYRKLDG